MRMIQMLRMLRQSMITIFCAFVLFGLAWLSFAHMNDPLSEWNPIIRLHPEVDLTYRIIVLSGEIAFLMILVAGVPIILSAIKQAFLARRRDILILFGIATFMGVVFALATILIITGLWNGGTNGIIIAPLTLVVLLVVTFTVARAVLKSEVSGRVLRLALVPTTLVTVAMGISLVATLIEASLLSVAMPRGFSDYVGINWIIGDVMMVVSLCLAIIALRRGFRARALTIV